MQIFTNLISQGGGVYFMYVYDFNAILTTAMKNRSDKCMILAFIELTEDVKSRGINPGFHFMDN